MLDTDVIFKSIVITTIVFFCVKYVFEYRLRDDLTVKHYVYDALYIFGCAGVGMYMTMVWLSEGGVSDRVDIFTDNPSF